jgi:hypothetical protein
MARAAADYNQTALVVGIAVPGKRQTTMAADRDLNRGMVVDGKIGEHAGNHEPTGSQLPHPHYANVALCDQFNAT